MLFEDEIIEELVLMIEEISYLGYNEKVKFLKLLKNFLIYIYYVKDVFYYFVEDICIKDKKIFFGIVELFKLGNYRYFSKYSKLKQEKDIVEDYSESLGNEFG